MTPITKHPTIVYPKLYEGQTTALSQTLNYKAYSAPSGPPFAIASPDPRNRPFSCISVRLLCACRKDDLLCQLLQPMRSSEYVSAPVPSYIMEYQCSPISTGNMMDIKGNQPQIPFLLKFYWVVLFISGAINNTEFYAFDLLLIIRWRTMYNTRRLPYRRHDYGMRALETRWESWVEINMAAEGYEPEPTGRMLSL